MKKIKKIWADLKENNKYSSGLVIKKYSSLVSSKGFVCILLPEDTKAICFHFEKANLPDIDAFPQLKEINFKLLNDNSNTNKCFFVISLSEISFEDVFSVICEDLLDYVETISDELLLLEEVQKRIYQWIELFRQLSLDELSVSQQLGLFGELLYLKELLSSPLDTYFILNLWVGPDHGIRDFEYKDWAVEVKTTAGHNKQQVKINSERQLDTSLLKYLFLIHISVEISKSDDSTLIDLIDEIRTILKPYPKVENYFIMKLLKRGLDIKLSNIRLLYDFKIRSEKYYIIKDDFPRIEEKDLRNGVKDVKYSIDIPLNDFEVTQSLIVNKLKKS